MRGQGHLPGRHRRVQDGVRPDRRRLQPGHAGEVPGRPGQVPAGPGAGVAGPAAGPEPGRRRDERAVLRLVGGDATDMAVLKQYFTGEQSLNALRDGYTDRPGMRARPWAWSTPQRRPPSWRRAWPASACSAASTTSAGTPTTTPGYGAASRWPATRPASSAARGTLLIAAGIITAPIAGADRHRARR